MTAFVTNEAPVGADAIGLGSRASLVRVCLGNKPGQRERERMLGQGDRGGGGPKARAAEVDAGPAWFPSHPQGPGKASGYFEDSA